MSADSFTVGDRVRTLAKAHSGHTRLPGYLCAKVGTVIALCGSFPLADERARGIVDARNEPVYSVRFDVGAHHVIADLWASYLERER